MLQMHYAVMRHWTKLDKTDWSDFNDCSRERAGFQEVTSCEGIGSVQCAQRLVRISSKDGSLYSNYCTHVTPHQKSLTNLVGASFQNSRSLPAIALLFQSTFMPLL